MSSERAEDSWTPAGRLAAHGIEAQDTTRMEKVVLYDPDQPAGSLQRRM
jgi:hypothetical protein